MFIFQQETAIKINISSDARRTEKQRYLGSDCCISKGILEDFSGGSESK